MTKKTDTIRKRDQLQRRAERGEITPRAYLDALESTWEQMSEEDKAREMKELS